MLHACVHAAVGTHEPAQGHAGTAHGVPAQLVMHRRLSWCLVMQRSPLWPACAFHSPGPAAHSRCLPNQMARPKLPGCLHVHRACGRLT